MTIISDSGGMKDSLKACWTNPIRKALLQTCHSGQGGALKLGPIRPDSAAGFYGEAMWGYFLSKHGVLKKIFAPRQFFPPKTNIM